jgi:RNA polymerase sigma-70 factor (ECF subfamily)
MSRPAETCTIRYMAVAFRTPAVDESRAAEDDRSLVEQIRRGDRASLGALYDRHAPALLATGIRMLGVEREAQDLLHDVFLEAWEHAREYDAARGSVRTWLLVRLRSRALDRLGRAERTRSRSLEGLAGNAAEAELESPEVPEALDGIAVRQALSRIDDDVRDVLELTYFRGLTAREIGARLGVPVGTVKSRLARGLGVLERLLTSGERSSENVD